MIGNRRKGYKTESYNLLRYVILSFAIILSIQVVLTFRLIDINYFDLLYKNRMFIPIAGSNVIASYIVPVICMFLVTFDSKSKYLKPFILLALFIGLILTKSRGGVVTLILTYVVYRMFIKSRFKISYAILIVIALFVVMQLLLSIPEVELFFLGFTADDSAVDARGLSSGRLTIYQHELERFLSHPLFGNGMVFNKYTSLHGSHNLIIELLVQSGIIGALLYIYPVCRVLKKAFNNLDIPYMKGWLLYIIAMLIHGMFEVNFFNWSTDLIFWFSCGVIMSICNNRSLLLK